MYRNYFSAFIFPIQILFRIVDAGAEHSAKETHWTVNFRADTENRG